MGVVVRRYIDILIIIITFPYSTCISSFLAATSLFLCSFIKCFFVLFLYRISSEETRLKKDYYDNYDEQILTTYTILSIFIQQILAC